MATHSDIAQKLYDGKQSIEVNPRLHGLKGPGIFWIGTKIKKPELLSWSTLHNLYDTNVLPVLTKINGIQSAMRLTAKDRSEEWPMLSLLAMQDLALIRSGLIEQGLDQRTELLPGSSKYYDQADFDCRFYNIISSCETSPETTMGEVPRMRCNG